MAPEGYCTDCSAAVRSFAAMLVASFTGFAGGESVYEAFPITSATRCSAASGRIQHTDTQQRTAVFLITFMVSKRLPLDTTFKQFEITGTLFSLVNIKSMIFKSQYQISGHRDISHPA